MYIHTYLDKPFLRLSSVVSLRYSDKLEDAVCRRSQWVEGLLKLAAVGAWSFHLDARDAAKHTGSQGSRSRRFFRLSESREKRKNLRVCSRRCPLLFLTAISGRVSSSSWDHLHLREGGGAHHLHLGGQREAQHPSRPAGRGLQHPAEGRHLGASGEHPRAGRLSAAAHSEYRRHSASGGRHRWGEGIVNVCGTR